MQTIQQKGRSYDLFAGMLVIGLIVVAGKFCSGGSDSGHSVSSQSDSRIDCTAINRKVYDCESCTLTDWDKKQAIDCKVQEMADDKGVTRDQLIKDHYENNQRNRPITKTATTEPPSEILDGSSVRRSAPQSQADWDKLMREAKKRDAEYRRRNQFDQ